jgi:hypothetical protein
MAYPEFRIRDIVTYTGYRSFQYYIEGGGGWVTVQIAADSYDDIVQIMSAINIALATVLTLAYDRTTRRFSFTIPAGAFKVRGNGDGLLGMLGFADSSAYAASQEAALPCYYLYTCTAQFRMTDDFPWSRGADWDRLSRHVSQTVSSTGRVCQIFGLKQLKTRTTIVTCAPDEDADWLAAFLDLVPGHAVAVYQDADVLTAYAVSANPWGYFLATLDEKSYTDFQCKRSLAKTLNLQDFTFTWRVNP